MWLRGVTGVALLLALAGCTGSTDADSDRAAADSGPALGGWEPPPGAPEFCGVLARAEHVDDIPGAVGRLLIDPADPQPAWRLTQGSGELRNARDAVREETGHPELAAALDDLVEALSLAGAGTLDEATSERIADGLTAVGRHAQAPCQFPT